MLYRSAHHSPQHRPYHKPRHNLRLSLHHSLHHSLRRPHQRPCHSQPLHGYGTLVLVVRLLGAGVCGCYWFVCAQVRKFDANKNRHYYANLRTRQTTWLEPAEGWTDARSKLKVSPLRTYTHLEFLLCSEQSEGEGREGIVIYRAVQLCGHRHVFVQKDIS